MNAQTKLNEKSGSLTDPETISVASEELQKQPFYQAIIKELKHDNSCGDPANTIEAFGDVEVEIMKRGTLSHTSIDWEFVEQQTLTLLASRSKDLRLLHCAVLILMRQKTALALATATACCFLFHHKFSSEMFPAKPRARITAIRTIVNDVGKLIDQLEPSAAELGFVIIARKMWSDFTLHLNRSDIGDTATILPNCEKLIRQLDQTIEVLQKTIPQTKSDGPQISTNPPSSQDEKSSTQVQKPAKIADESDKEIPAPKTPEPVRSVSFAIETADLKPEDSTKFRKALFSLADTLLELDPSDRTAYLVRRRAIWHGIDQAPPIKTDNKIDIPNPVSMFSDEYETALDEMSPSTDLLKRLEQNLNLVPYWLDGHFIAAKLAERSGHIEVAVEVAAALRGFLSRVPDLHNLAFSDGTPVVSERVSKWLAPEPSQPAIISRIDPPGPLDLAKCAEQGQLASEDLMELETQLVFAGSERDQTWIEIHMLEDMRNRGLSHFTAIHARRLQEQLGKRSVLDWESGLAVRLHDLAQAKAGER